MGEGFAGVDLDTVLSNAEPVGDNTSDTSQVDGKSDGAPRSGTQEAEGREAPRDNILDLDKLERFRFENRELTPKELKRAFLRQEDYSRKTQELSKERESVEQSKQEFNWYAKNFQADLPRVLKNPALLKEMAKHYPEEFVQRASEIVKSLGQRGTESSAPKADDNPLAREIEAIKEWKGDVEAQIQQANAAKADALLETWFGSCEKKYPEAEIVVCTEIARQLATKLEAQRPPQQFTQEHLERIFKADHESREAKYAKKYRAKVEEQKGASSKAKDTGAGGGTPGHAPVKARTIKEATAQYLKDLER